MNAQSANGLFFLADAPATTFVFFELTVKCRTTASTQVKVRVLALAGARGLASMPNLGGGYVFIVMQVAVQYGLF
jgi:hypothetical protein